MACPRSALALATLVGVLAFMVVPSAAAPHVCHVESLPAPGIKPPLGWVDKGCHAEPRAVGPMTGDGWSDGSDLEIGGNGALGAQDDLGGDLGESDDMDRPACPSEEALKDVSTAMKVSSYHPRKPNPQAERLLSYNPSAGSSCPL